MTPTARARKQVLDHLAAAIDQLQAATQAACPLKGWVNEWQAIGDHMDATRALWHRIADAPHPIGHDDESPA